MDSSIKSVSEILANAHILDCAEFCDKYNFDDVNAGEYFDELIENSKFSSPIFSGIMIMEKNGDDFTVVDGLQRLTTISLLLCALCEAYKNTSQKNDDAKNKIFERFLLCDGNPKLNLHHGQEVYKKILFSQELDEKETRSNLALTYIKFLELIKKSKIKGTEFFRIVSKIQFMFVLIDKSEVSIKALYKTLNQNKDKSQINMIFNYIAQRCDSTRSLWEKTLRDYQECGIENLFDDFLRDFLIIQNDGKAPNKNALYNNFKSYFIKMLEYQNDDKTIETLCTYAGYYLKIIRADFEDAEIKEQIFILQENKGQDAYSYLMEVLDDLQNGLINTEVLHDILIMINSFIVKRGENPLSGATISFAGLSKEINKMLVLKNYTPQIIDESKLTINEVNKLSAFDI